MAQNVNQNIAKVAKDICQNMPLLMSYTRNFKALHIEVITIISYIYIR